MEVQFILAFILWHYIHGSQCPCSDVNPKCGRVEFYGFQLNHIALFIVLGYLFPNRFLFFMTMGILWEIYEYILQRNPKYIHQHLGGCLKIHPPGMRQNPWNFNVYSGEKKYLNPVDKFFNIPVDTSNTWQPSVTEVLANLVGFMIGLKLRELN
jgi:hypothetical protein